MFMTARRYAQVGPFPDEVFMEDFELTRRIRRQAIAEGGAYVWLPWCWWCRSMLAVAVHQRWLRACRYVCPASYPILPAVALCDGRRWEMNGVLKNTLLNQYFVWLYVACRALTQRDGHSLRAPVVGYVSRYTSRGYTPGQIYNMYYASKIKQGATPQPTARRSTASPSSPARPAAPAS